MEVTEPTWPHYQWIIWTLMCLSPIIGMAVDLVAPSLPSIVTALHTSTNFSKNIITSYLIGYAIGNLLSGFLSDAYGRRQLLRGSLLAFVCVSIVPIVWVNIDVLIIVRAIQGLALGSCAVVSRSIYADIVPREKMVHLGTILGTLWGLGPMIGPVIGGYLQMYFGWQACFYFFAIATGIVMVMVFCIVPETHFQRRPLHWPIITKNMAEVLTHKSFMATVLLMGLVYSLIIVFHTLGPFLIQNTLGHSPVFFGRLALWMGVCFLLSTFVSRALIKRFTVATIYRTATRGFFIGGLLALLLSYSAINPIALIAVTSGGMFFMAGLIFPMSMGKGLSMFRSIAGTATATMFFINTLIASSTAFVMSFVTLHSATALIWMYCLMIGLSLLVYQTLLHNCSICASPVVTQS